LLQVELSKILRKFFDNSHNSELMVLRGGLDTMSDPIDVSSNFDAIAIQLDLVPMKGTGFADSRAGVEKKAVESKIFWAGLLNLAQKFRDLIHLPVREFLEFQSEWFDPFHRIARS
jgi:hypothetical protein